MQRKVMDIYSKLCGLTNEKLTEYDSELAIHFETPEGLKYTVFSYPRSALLEVKETSEFVRECFYKILDRAVDKSSYVHYCKALNSSQMSRDEMIEELVDSDERKIKKTVLV
ncbi:MAG: DUF4214 domain-containing protein [Cycloclasticus sp.]|jgi:hypothetical protein|nr:DUF4214 domain-containing protein [Gammaproteobacteria bacterium]